VNQNYGDSIIRSDHFSSTIAYDFLIVKSKWNISVFAIVQRRLPIEQIVNRHAFSVKLALASTAQITIQNFGHATKTPIAHVVPF
jgi:hypothetical protein